MRGGLPRAGTGDRSTRIPSAWSVSTRAGAGSSPSVRSPRRHFSARTTRTRITAVDSRARHAAVVRARSREHHVTGAASRRAHLVCALEQLRVTGRPDDKRDATIMLGGDATWVMRVRVVVPGRRRRGGKDRGVILLEREWRRSPAGGIRVDRSPVPARGRAPRVHRSVEAEREGRVTLRAGPRRRRARGLHGRWIESPDPRLSALFEILRRGARAARRRSIAARARSRWCRARRVARR
jgi:hypothetical protein